MPPRDEPAKLHSRPSLDGVNFSGTSMLLKHWRLELIFCKWNPAQSVCAQLASMRNRAEQLCQYWHMANASSYSSDTLNHLHLHAPHGHAAVMWASHFGGAPQTLHKFHQGLSVWLMLTCSPKHRLGQLSTAWLTRCSWKITCTWKVHLPAASPWAE